MVRSRVLGNMLCSRQDRKGIVNMGNHCVVQGIQPLHINKNKGHLRYHKGKPIQFDFFS